MTFKHTKFEESAVMRSLERLAKEKNPVQPEIKKEAATVDLMPTGSLVENVIHLCAGLRQSGFAKYADELETNFVHYKQAQTLYETSTEKGEDLVDRAHPKGSHKLEDVEGDEAVFETIVDRHLKSVKMVEKTPTGKLSTAADIINAVKIVLADEHSELVGQLSAKMARLRNLVDTLNNRTKEELTFSIKHEGGLFVSNDYQKIMELSQKPNGVNLQTITKSLNNLRSRLSPGVLYGLSEDSWKKVEPIIDAALTTVAQAVSINSQIVDLERTKVTKEFEEAPKQDAAKVSLTNTNSFGVQAQKAYNKLDTLLKLIQTSADANRKSRAAAWVNTRKAKLDQITNAINSAGWGTPHGEEVAEAMMPQATPVFAEVEKASFKP